METLTTHGIQISVECHYQMRFSEPITGKQLFNYTILIVNKSAWTVKLLRRHWFIFDSLNGVQEVEGEGVVGQQPVLAPGEQFQYSSWCPLVSEVGRMNGIYLMERLPDGLPFEVIIPPFALISDPKLN